MEHDDLKGVEQQYVACVVCGHALDGGDAAPKVQVLQFDGANQPTQPIEIEALGRRFAYGLNQSLHLPGIPLPNRVVAKVRRDRAWMQWDSAHRAGVKPY